MSKKVKILLVLFLVFVGGTIGLFAFISSKINPEELKKLTLSIMAEQMPKAVTTIDQIDYSIGTSLRLYVKNFGMKVKENNDPLTTVGEIEIKIPLLAILTNGGTVEINVKAPTLDYITYQNGANWLNVLPESKPSEAPKAEGKKEDMKLPDFISKSKIDVRFEDINLNYKDLNAPASQVKVSRIVIKDINLETTTAFEVASDIDFNLSPSRNIKVSLLVVGQAHPGQFLKEKKLDASLVATLTDIKVSDLDFNLPNVKSKVSVKMNPQGHINADLDTDLENVGDIKAVASMVGKQVTVSSLGVKIILAGALGILPKETTEKLKMIDLGDSELHLDGKVEMNLESKALNPNLNFAIDKPIVLKSVEGVNLKSKVKGEIQHHKISMDVITEVLEGVITTKVATEIDLMNANFAPAALPPVFVKIEGSNLKVKKSYLQNLIYGGKKKEEPAPSDKPVPPKIGEPLSLPTIHLAINFSHFMIADEVFELDAKINTSGQHASSEKFHFTFSKGVGDLGFNTHLIDTANIKNQINFKMSSLNLNAFNSFLPPLLSGVGGIFDGKVNGELDLLSKGMKYHFNVDVVAKDGEFKDLDLAKYILPIIDGIPQLKGKVKKDDLILSDKFEKLTLQTEASDKVIDLKKFDFIGAPNTTDLNGKGEVSMSEKDDSEVFLTFKPKGGKMAADLQTYVGRKDLPLRLTGKGFFILPDYQYTLGALAGGALKIQVDKGKVELQKKANVEKKKLQEKAKKEGKKLENKAKDEASKLLKGFLKK